jgi:hypothetical protein
MKSLFDTHALSLSLSEHPARTQAIELRPDDRASADACDDDGIAAGAAFQPPATGIAQQTWVLDHDVLELRYVN